MSSFLLRCFVGSSTTEVDDARLEAEENKLRKKGRRRYSWFWMQLKTKKRPVIDGLGRKSSGRIQIGNSKHQAAAIKYITGRRKRSSQPHNLNKYNWSATGPRSVSSTISTTCSTKKADSTVASSPSSSIPPPPKPERAAVTLQGSEIWSSERRKTYVDAENLDSNNVTMFVGFVLINLMMTMIAGGRVFAIVCTCFWLCLVPLMKPSNSTNNTTVEATREDGVVGAIQIDYDNKEEKKRVILEGFLERNHRRPPGS